MSRVPEPRRLDAVDCLSESTLEKGVLDVELVNRPTSRDCKGQHSTNNSRLDDRAEGLTKVNTRAMRVSTNNPVSLVALEGAIRVVLDLEHPLVRDNISSGRARYEISSLVLGESSNLLFHSSAPVRIGESCTKGLGERRKWRCVKQGGLAETRLGTGHHAMLIDDRRHRDCPFGQRRNSNTG
jgi:hypothetical protein